MKIEYIIVKEKTEISSNKSTFLKLLETNSDLTVDNNIIKYSDYEADYNLTCEESEDKTEIIFHLIIKSNIEPQEDLENLNSVARGIRKTIKGSGYSFHFNTIWDETSQYYCEKSYPLINTVENLMRKLIFQFMLKSIGSKWIKEAFPKKLKQKISETAKKNDAQDLLKDSLYHADFIQLIELLFVRYTKIQGINKLFEKIESVEEIEDLEEIKNLKPKSNWDRYFSDLIEFENLDETWKTLYEYRNTIAHNKLINKNDYKEVIKLTELVQEKLNEALAKLEEIEIPEEEKEDISSFTSKSMKSNHFWSKNYVDDPLGFVTDYPFDLPKCKECGNAIDPTKGMPMNGYCSDCAVNSVLSEGIYIEQKCKICGGSIDNDSEFNMGICSSCMTSSFDPISEPSYLDENLNLATNINFLDNLLTNYCVECGKSFSGKSTEIYCKDCRDNYT